VATVYHLLAQSKRVKNRQEPPYGRGETLELMRHEGRTYRHTGLLKWFWQEQDKIIHANFRLVYKMKNDLPPCHDCQSQIVAFCCDTGSECRAFIQWADTGKRRD
jgi:hypothetical protein